MCLLIANHICSTVRGTEAGEDIGICTGQQGVRGGTPTCPRDLEVASGLRLQRHLHHLGRAVSGLGQLEMLGEE